MGLVSMWPDITWIEEIKKSHNYDLATLVEDLRLKNEEDCECLEKMEKKINERR